MTKDNHQSEKTRERFLEERCINRNIHVTIFSEIVAIMVLIRF